MTFHIRLSIRTNIHNVISGWGCGRFNWSRSQVCTYLPREHIALFLFLYYDGLTSWTTLVGRVLFVLCGTVRGDIGDLV